MKGKGGWSPELRCLVVGRTGRTREAAQATGWEGRGSICFFPPTHMQLSCGTDCCRMLGQTEVSMVHALLLGEKSPSRRAEDTTHCLMPLSYGET